MNINDMLTIIVLKLILNMIFATLTINQIRYSMIWTSHPILFFNSIHIYQILVLKQKSQRMLAKNNNLLSKFFSQRNSHKKQQSSAERHKHCASNCPDHNSFASSLRKYPSNKDLRRSNASTANLTSHQNKSSHFNKKQQQSRDSEMRSKNYSGKYIRAFRQCQQPLQDSFANIKINEKSDKLNALNTGKQIEFYLVKQALKGKNKAQKQISIRKKQEKADPQSKLISVEETQYERIKNNILRVSSVIDKMAEKFLDKKNLTEEINQKREIKFNQQNIFTKQHLKSEPTQNYPNKNKTDKNFEGQIAQKKTNLIQKTPTSNKSQYFGYTLSGKTGKKSSQMKGSSNKRQIVWQKSNILNYQMK